MARDRLLVLEQHINGHKGHKGLSDADKVNQNAKTSHGGGRPNQFHNH
jgi:hypothetical protein